MRRRDNDDATTHSDVAKGTLSQSLRKHHNIMVTVSRVSDQVDDAVPIGSPTRHERDARRAAVRDRCVCLLEHDALLCEVVQVWRASPFAAVCTEVWSKVVKNYVQDIDTISRNSGNGNHEQPAHARCDCHVKMSGPLASYSGRHYAHELWHVLCIC